MSISELDKQAIAMMAQSQGDDSCILARAHIAHEQELRQQSDEMTEIVQRLTALERPAQAAPTPPRPVVELKEGQVWTKDRYAKDDECITLYFYDGDSCRSFHENARESRAVSTRLPFEEDIPIDRVAPILLRFGFDVRGPASSLEPATPGPERYGCRIVRMPDQNWDVVSPDGSNYLLDCGVGVWQRYDSHPDFPQHGQFLSPTRAAEWLAKAPPPPGYTAPPLPDDATLRAAGWVRADAILALIGKEPARD